MDARIHGVDFCYNALSEIRLFQRILDPGFGGNGLNGWNFSEFEAHEILYMLASRQVSPQELAPHMNDDLELELQLELMDNLAIKCAGRENLVIWDPSGYYH